MRRQVILIGGAVGLAAAVALLATIARDSDRAVAPFANDHWHAPYQVWVCGELQDNFPQWEGGVATEGDGVIHIHPFTPAEEGEGAALGKFFEYGGGALTATSMRMVGDDHTYRNGDECPGGSEAAVSVWVNGEQIDDWVEYVPQDRDRISVSFGDPGELPSGPSPAPWTCEDSCPLPNLWDSPEFRAAAAGAGLTVLSMGATSFGGGANIDVSFAVDMADAAAVEQIAFYDETGATLPQYHETSWSEPALGVQVGIAGVRRHKDDGRFLTLAVTVDPAQAAGPDSLVVLSVTFAESLQPEFEGSSSSGVAPQWVVTADGVRILQANRTPPSPFVYVERDEDAVAFTRMDDGGTIKISEIDEFPPPDVLPQPAVEPGPRVP